MCVRELSLVMSRHHPTSLLPSNILECPPARLSGGAAIFETAGCRHSPFAAVAVGLLSSSIRLLLTAKKNLARRRKMRRNPSLLASKTVRVADWMMYADAPIAIARSLLQSWDFSKKPEVIAVSLKCSNNVCRNGDGRTAGRAGRSVPPPLPSPLAVGLRVSILPVQA